MIRIAIVILNWNGKKYLEQFLHKVKDRSKVPGTEIIVADNGSTDGSVEWLEQKHSDIKIIKFNSNHGFTGGYNKALKLIEAEYYVLLNSDAEVSDGWLEPMFRYMEEHHECAACMPKVKSYSNKSDFEYAGASGGYIDIFGYPFCRGRILSYIEKDSGQYDTPREVFWASGVALMIRSEIFHAVGGFDEIFFAHMEEIDLCWRIKHAGHTIMVIPQSEIYHVGGGTLPNNSPRKLYLNYRNNLLMLYKNLPDMNRHLILFIRKMLDGMSAIIYLFQGRYEFFKSVVKAHCDYYKLKKAVSKTRTTPRYNNRGIYRGSIVLKFFMKDQKLRFDQIENLI